MPKATTPYHTSNKLLTSTDWDLAGILFGDVREPMLVDRKVCTITSPEEGCIVIVVAHGPHPFIKGESASAEHHIRKADITGVSYYNELPAPRLQSLSGSKTGKIITD